MTRVTVRAHSDDMHHWQASSRHGADWESLAESRRRATQGLIDRDVVGVTVSNLPHTLVAPKDVCDAEGVRLHWDADHRVGDVFEANDVREVPTHVRRDYIEAIVGAV